MNIPVLETPANSQLLSPSQKCLLVVSLTNVTLAACLSGIFFNIGIIVSMYVPHCKCHNPTANTSVEIIFQSSRNNPIAAPPIPSPMLLHPIKHRSVCALCCLPAQAATIACLSFLVVYAHRIGKRLLPPSSSGALQVRLPPPFSLLKNIQCIYGARFRVRYNCRSSGRICYGIVCRCFDVIAHLGFHIL
jgi:hypothetical protein